MLNIQDLLIICSASGGIWTITSD